MLRAARRIQQLRSMGMAGMARIGPWGYSASARSALRQSTIERGRKDSEQKIKSIMSLQLPMKVDFTHSFQRLSWFSSYRHPLPDVGEKDPRV